MEQDEKVQEVMEALKRCYDPEIPINIVDLGLVYEVKVEEGKARVKMTLTAPGCPAHSFIAESVKKQLLTVPGIREAEVEVVWDPPWSPERMSEEAKKMLGFPVREPSPPQIRDDSRLVRRGKSLNQEDGTILLVSEMGRGYKVSPEVLAFWNLCDGSRPFSELLKEMAKMTDMKSEELRPQLVDLVERLAKAGLVSV